MKQIPFSVGLLLLVGCGQKVDSIEGTVLVNGEPLDRVAVQFWADEDDPEPSGVAITQSDGSFTYRPTKYNDSPWKPDTYLVRIVDPKSTILLRDPPESRGKPRVPWKYFHIDETPLRVELDHGANRVGILELGGEEAVVSALGGS